MSARCRPRCGILFVLVLIVLTGCSGETSSYPLDQELARASVGQAMQAWADGRTPSDLKPEIVIGDESWEHGEKLVSYEILSNEESSDGSNLHICVLRKFESSESKVTYIVGTSPVVTVFPQ